MHRLSRFGVGSVVEHADGHGAAVLVLPWHWSPVVVKEFNRLLAVYDRACKALDAAEPDAPGYGRLKTRRGRARLELQAWVRNMI